MATTTKSSQMLCLSSSTLDCFFSDYSFGSTTLSTGMTGISMASDSALLLQEVSKVVDKSALAVEKHHQTMVRQQQLERRFTDLAKKISQVLFKFIYI
jgi:hypothetical protein